MEWAADQAWEPTGDRVQGWAAAGDTISVLIEVAARGLEKMFDRQSGLFCYKMQPSATGLVSQGSSLRYTFISLLGLHRLAQSRQPTPVEVDAALHRLLREPGGIDNIGNLGLLLWACAQILPEQVPRACRIFRLEGALDRFPDYKAGKTMELAWLLAGLSYCRDVAPGERGLSEQTQRAYELLRGNHVAATGLFRHQGRGTLAGRLRGRFSNFPDQVYSAYALARFSRSCGVPEALEAALLCAGTICELQGPLGQWWWHYDAETGRVIGRYPVFSVHQDAMAPMALMALRQASGKDFSQPMRKGLAWVWGENELGRDLVDPDNGLIWRGLQRWSRREQWTEEAVAFFAKRRIRQDSALTVNQECRPYHLGWLLYAFAA